MAVVLTNGEYYISHDNRTGGIVKISNVEEAQVFYSCNTAMRKVFKAPSKCKGYYPFELDNMDCGCKVKNGRKKYTKEERKMVYEKADGCCMLCGQKMLLEDMTLDHIVPLSMGGKDEMANLQAAHRECNQFKSNILPEDFLDRVVKIFTYQMEQNHSGNQVWGVVRELLEKIV